MFRLDQGAFKLFQVSGLSVSVHWSWLLVAAYEVQSRRGGYSSIFWTILEYLALFLLVLLHEFGHALATRSVGGTADRIVLWPLGGVAYVQPPERAGATLWAIAAGPLVNLALLPLLGGIAFLMNLSRVGGDVQHLFDRLFVIDLVLFVFNLLPIYPLDGGKILHSLLWPFLGRARALRVATLVGLAGAGCLLVYAILRADTWLIYLAAYGGYSAWNGYQQAGLLLERERAPRRANYVCPSCRQNPRMGAFWSCPCGQRVDVFADGGVCAKCSRTLGAVPCIDCKSVSTVSDWSVRAA